MQRFFSSMLLSMVLSACAEPQSIRLHSDNERLVLDYECTDSVPKPLAGTPLDLIRGKITQETADHIMAAPVTRVSGEHAQAVRQAHTAGDLPALELAVVSYVCAHGQPPIRPPRFPEPGSSTPAIALSPLSDEEEILSPPARLPDQRGRPVVVSFWASWCIPCRKEYPELRAMARRAEAEGFDLFVVLHGDTREGLRKWKNEHGGEVPFYWDANGRAARAFQIQGVPHTYVIGSDGHLIDAAPGGGYGRLNGWVQRALSSSGATEATLPGSAGQGRRR